MKREPNQEAAAAEKLRTEYGSKPVKMAGTRQWQNRRTSILGVQIGTVNTQDFGLVDLSQANGNESRGKILSELKVCADECCSCQSERKKQHLVIWKKSGERAAR